MRTSVRFFILVGAILLGAQNIPASPTLQFSFGERRVTVTGVRPHHTIVLFGDGLGRYSGAPLLTHEARTAADDDGDGTIDFKVLESPPAAVWAAIDLEDGDYVIAASSGSLVKEMRMSPDAWRVGGDRAEFTAGYLDVLVVRPRVGAWVVRIGDGGPDDTDGKRDGAIGLRLNRMRPLVGTQGGPPVVIGRDVIVAINPDTLQTFVRQAE